MSNVNHPMAAGPAPAAQPKQSTGVVLTCVFTALTFAGLAYILYLLNSSAGPNFESGDNGVETGACPSALTVINLSGTSAEDCVQNLSRRLAMTVIVAVPTAVFAAVALSRWLTHMGFKAEYLRIG